MLKCQNLRQITLLTGVDPGDAESQKRRLEQTGASLAERGIKLTITYSNTLHDREIRSVWVDSLILALPK